jgi:hypothetical protein
MGQEILYCSKCQVQLRSADFEKQKAYRLHNSVYCAKCARESIHSLPPETVKKLIEEIARQEGAAEKKNSSTSRILRVAEIRPGKPMTSRRTPDGGSKTPGSSGWMVTGVLLGLAGLVGAVFISGSNPKGTPRVPSSPAGAPAPGRDSRMEAEASAPRNPPSAPPPGASGTFTAEATESLRRAREFARTNPGDLVGQIGLFEKALWDSGGTPLLDPAKRELENLKVKDRELAAKDLPGLMDQVRSAAGREEFGPALSFLEKARPLHAASEWTGALEKAAKDVRVQAAGLYAPIKKAAATAARARASGELAKLRMQVARWGLEEYRIDLEEELSRAPPAPDPAPSPNESRPPANPESLRIHKIWESAMELAGARDYEAACRELEKAAPEIKDPALRKEVALDVETIRLGSGLLKESLQALGAWPRDQKLRVDYLDEAGVPASVEGFLERIDASRVEVRKDKETVAIEWGELLAGTLAEAYRRRPGRAPAADGRVLGTFFLLEGDAPSARGHLGDSSALVPAKYWGWAEQAAVSRRKPEGVRREMEARRIFYAAGRDYAFFPSRADSVLRFRALESRYADTAFVRRNLASVTRYREAPREFFFLPDDLRAAGTFKPSEAKSGPCWTAESDSDPSVRKNNFIDLEFSVLPEAGYRCWIYVGGCCAETLSFHLQGTEMKWTGPDPQHPVSIEPGDASQAPVKFNVGNAPRTHAQHGGKKQPSRWGWAEVALPRYGAGGPKTVRIMTDQQGFSLAYAVVTSVRRSPPTDVELKDLVKSGRASRIAGPESGLAAHWTLDEGKGTAVADASPNRIQGTLVHGPAWTEGKIGGALGFSGSGAAVSMPAAPPLADLGPLSIAAWIKPEKLQLGRVVAKEDAGRGRWMLIAGDKSIAFAKDFATQEVRRETVAGLLTPGVWHHVAVTWNGTASAAQIHLYVNGLEPSYSVNQDGAGEKMSDAAIPLFIGNRGDLARGFSGSIDDVRIYRRVLGAAEVMNLAALKAK